MFWMLIPQSFKRDLCNEHGNVKMAFFSHVPVIFIMKTYLRQGAAELPAADFRAG